VPRCLYINLDSAVGRAAAVEASFAAVPHGDWRLERLPAVAPHRPGMATAEACFESHLAALTSALEDAEPVFITEDDVVFSRETFAIVDQLVAGEHVWDLLFTDVIVLDLALLLDLARSRRQLAAGGGRTLRNLAVTPCTGSTAYVVRAGAKARLHAALQKADPTRPFDLVLGDLIRQGAFQGRFVFPFVTTVDSLGDRSQIDPGDDRDLWRATLNLFRRLMFVDRDLDACARDADRLATAGDQESAVLAQVLAALTSPAFPVASPPPA
jgi:GR25 family glycosyltransferase involved in LPS biosynthesis